MSKLEKYTKEILRNDNLINDIIVERQMVYNNVFQCKLEEETITKYVYKIHNDVFNVNKTIKDAPKCQCIFILHIDKKSSSVQVFDDKNKEIFRGNSLWVTQKHKSYDEHVNFIKMLHSVKDVEEKYDCC